MDEKILAKAMGKVSDTRVLINGISKRATQLARGAHPLIELAPGHKLECLDIAIIEVAEGKLTMTSPALERQEARDAAGKPPAAESPEAEAVE